MVSAVDSSFTENRSVPAIPVENFQTADFPVSLGSCFRDHQFALVGQEDKSPARDDEPSQAHPLLLPGHLGGQEVEAPEGRVLRNVVQAMDPIQKAVKHN
jgi:hypothetical protein